MRSHANHDGCGAACPGRDTNAGHRRVSPVNVAVFRGKGTFCLRRSGHVCTHQGSTLQGADRRSAHFRRGSRQEEEDGHVPFELRVRRNLEVGWQCHIPRRSTALPSRATRSLASSSPSSSEAMVQRFLTLLLARHAAPLTMKIILFRCVSTLQLESLLLCLRFVSFQRPRARHCHLQCSVHLACCLCLVDRALTESDDCADVWNARHSSAHYNIESRRGTRISITLILVRMVQLF